MTIPNHEEPSVIANNAADALELHQQSFTGRSDLEMRLAVRRLVWLVRDLAIATKEPGLTTVADIYERDLLSDDVWLDDEGNAYNAAPLSYADDHGVSDYERTEDARLEADRLGRM